MLGGVGTPGPYGTARVAPGDGGEYGGQPGPRPPRHVVEPRRGPAVAPVPGRPVPDHRVERVDGPEPDEPGHPADGPPHERPHHGVGGVLGDGLDDGPRDPVRVERLRIPPAQMRQPLPRRPRCPRRRAPRRWPAPPGPARSRRRRPRWRRRSARRRRRGTDVRTTGAPTARAATAPPAHTAVCSAPRAAVVPPQHPFHGAGGPPERGDRMPAARVAEQQVAEEAGGGAVREDAIGTHRLSRPWVGRRGSDWSGDCRPAAEHGDMSSLRVSTPWFDETGGESSWLPGRCYPGDSGGTAPDSHRLPLLPP